MYTISGGPLTVDDVALEVIGGWWAHGKSIPYEKDGHTLFEFLDQIPSGTVYLALAEFLEAEASVMWGQDPMRNTLESVAAHFRKRA